MPYDLNLAQLVDTKPGQEVHDFNHDNYNTSSKSIPKFQTTNCRFRSGNGDLTDLGPSAGRLKTFRISFRVGAANVLVHVFRFERAPGGPLVIEI